MMSPAAREAFAFQQQIVPHPNSLPDPMPRPKGKCQRAVFLRAGASAPLAPPEASSVLRTGLSRPSFRQSGVPRVVLQDVTKVFETSARQSNIALEEVNLSAEEKECLVVVGPSGSGKTTLLRLIAGLETPTTGQVLIDSQIVTRLQPQSRPVAMVFQEPALYPHMSVGENLAFGLRLRGCSKPEIARRIGRVVEMLGLETYREARTNELSGGQRQRVALGRALVRQAKILLLDEPLANLDPRWRTQLRQDISLIRENLQATFIYVTHDHLDATLTGDRIAVFREGRLQQIASPDTLYEQPKNIFVAEFFGFPAINLFSGHLVRHLDHVLFRVDGVASDPSSAAKADPNRVVQRCSNDSPAQEHWSLRLDDHWSRVLNGSAALPAFLGIRPEHISCGAPKPGAQTCSTVTAIINQVRRVGPELYLSARANGIPLMARAPADYRADLEKEYSFCFETKSACLFDSQTGGRIVLP
jgi:multiple sugar transport system ATP-binding protein